MNWLTSVSSCVRHQKIPQLLDTNGLTASAEPWRNLRFVSRQRSGLLLPFQHSPPMAEYSDVFCGGNGIKSATGWRIQTILCQRNMRTCTIKRKGPPYWHPVRDPRRTGKRTTVLFTSRSQGFPRYNGDYTSGGVLKKVGFLICTAITPLIW